MARTVEVVGMGLEWISSSGTWEKKKKFLWKWIKSICCQLREHTEDVLDKGR